MVRGSAALATIVGLVLPSAGARAHQTPLSVPLERAGFEKIHHSRGVTVYSHKDSKVLHVAGEGKLNAPPATVQAVLVDYERQAGHIGRISEVRVLKRRPGALVVYMRLNLPIISDRDYTLKVRWDQRAEVRWISFQASGEGPAPRKGVVRVTHNVGSWQLKPIWGGRGTFARYQLQMDIAGWVPTWLVRRAAGKEIPEVFAQFSRMLTESKRGAVKIR